MLKIYTFIIIVNIIFNQNTALSIKSLPLTRRILSLKTKIIIIKFKKNIVPIFFISENQNPIIVGNILYE